MFYCSLASGSGGNVSVCTAGHMNLLIDAGTNAKYILSALERVDVDPQKISHILITHSHDDHISALRVLNKKLKAKLICSAETAPALKPLWDDISVFHPGERFFLGELLVSTFSTPHDCPGSCGFVLGRGEERLGYCTDVGHMTGEIMAALSGCHHIVLESNHDVEMLKNGPYPYHLKQRILSQNGHLSNEECASALGVLVRSGVKSVTLAHLSETNNTPEKAIDAAIATTASAGIKLWAAPVKDMFIPAVF